MPANCWIVRSDGGQDEAVVSRDRWISPSPRLRLRRRSAPSRQRADGSHLHAWSVPAALAIIAATSLLATVDVGATSASTTTQTVVRGQVGPSSLLLPSGTSRPAPTDQEPAPGPTPVDLDVLAARPLDYPVPFARVEELVLLVPTTDPIVVGFHEAATTDAIAMTPVGVLVANRNATRTEAPSDEQRGPPYLILHSRGRAAAATSAVDVVMRDDDPVRAPVSGVVTDIREVALSGRYPDLRVEIQPQDAPELRVIVIHVDEVTVGVGDPVVAGETMIAGTARRFPFFSQIDGDTAPERWPHIHLEIKPATAMRPGDAYEE